MRGPYILHLENRKKKLQKIEAQSINREEIKFYVYYLIYIVLVMMLYLGHDSKKSSNLV